MVPLLPLWVFCLTSEGTPQGTNKFSIFCFQKTRQIRRIEIVIRPQSRRDSVKFSVMAAILFFVRSVSGLGSFFFVPVYTNDYRCSVLDLHSLKCCIPRTASFRGVCFANEYVPVHSKGYSSRVMFLPGRQRFWNFLFRYWGRG